MGLQIRAAWKLQEGQPHAANKNLIRTNGRRGRKAVSAAGADQIVLIHSITADSNAANQHAIFVNRNAAWKDLNAVGQVWNRAAGNARPTDGCQQVCLDQV